MQAASQKIFDLVFFLSTFFIVVLSGQISAEARSSQAGIIIKLRAGVDIETVVNRYKADYGTGYAIDSYKCLDKGSTCKLTISQNGSISELLQYLNSDIDVEKAVADCHSFELSPLKASYSSLSARPVVFRDGKELYERQKPFSLLGFKLAHKTCRGSGAVVAIIDTGADLEHPVLRGRISKFSHDFVDSDQNPSEVQTQETRESIYGHGTFVAGIVALAAPSAELMVLRTFDAEGQASNFDVANAIRYAVNYGATVINLSCVSSSRDELVAEALSYAQERGVVVVVAAGNSNSETPIPFPAAEPNVLSVAATDTSDLKTKFSNYGNHISLSAPGTGVFSVYPGGQFASWNGTSFAAPWVAASIALLSSCQTVSSLTATEILKASTVDLNRRNPSYAGKLGKGRISLKLAFRRVV
ncbi:MAG: S8 family serine peptidase [Blastocatellia bacterium]|nr:S8 family serine peptidase [Blastocatellia bacterium]